MYNEKIEFKETIPFIIKMQSINRYSIHWHENITEIILPIKGSVEIASSFECNLINEGDFSFINNKSIHSISSSDNAIIAVFYINLDYFQNQFKYIKYMSFRSNVYSKNPNSLNCDIRIEYKKRFRNLLISILSDTLNGNLLLGELVEKYEYQLIYSMVYEFN